MAVDGDLSDGPAAPAAILNDAGQIFPAVEDLRVFWGGMHDLAGTVRAQWNEDNLYLAFDIGDDILYFSPGALHKGDSIEVYFNMDLSDEESPFYTEYTTHLKLAPPASGKEGKARLSGKRGRQGRTLKSDEIAAVWRKTASGYLIEAQIPGSC